MVRDDAILLPIMGQEIHALFQSLVSFDFQDYYKGKHFLIYSCPVCEVKAPARGGVLFTLPPCLGRPRMLAPVLRDSDLPACQAPQLR